MPKDEPVPRLDDPAFAKLVAESAHLKRRSAELLKRIVDMDEKIAERLPLTPPRTPRRKP